VFHVLNKQILIEYQEPVFIALQDSNIIPQKKYAKQFISDIYQFIILANRNKNKKTYKF
jgi:hypothetical protein